MTNIFQYFSDGRFNHQLDTAGGSEILIRVCSSLVSLNKALLNPYSVGGTLGGIGLRLLMVQKSGKLHQLRLLAYPPLFTAGFIHPRQLFGISSVNITRRIAFSLRTMVLWETNLPFGVRPKVQVRTVSLLECTGISPLSRL